MFNEYQKEEDLCFAFEEVEEIFTQPEEEDSSYIKTGDEDEFLLTFEVKPKPNKTKTLNKS